MGFWSKLLFGVGAYHSLVRKPEQERKAAELRQRRLTEEARLVALVRKAAELENTIFDEKELVRRLRPLKTDLYSIDRSVLSEDGHTVFRQITEVFIEKGV